MLFSAFQVQLIARLCEATRWQSDARIQATAAGWSTVKSFTLLEEIQLTVCHVIIVKITDAGERFYLASWPGPLLRPMHEQRLVHLFDCDPIVLAVKMWKPMQ